MKRPTMKCLNCESELRWRGVQYANKYCNNKCQKEFEYKQYIVEWKSGNAPKKTSGVSGHIRRYLLDKQNNKCYTCGIDSWNNNPIVLEVEHKDGNSSNNIEENLIMLCPNCHSQTPTYKGANKGNGRHYRRVRYFEGKSF